MYLHNGVRFTKSEYVILDDDHGWLSGCPDEIYPINWFAYLYGNRLKKHLDNKITTYTHWNIKIDPDHPLVLDLPNTKKNKNRVIKTGAIFARKFTKEGADLMALN